MKRKFVTFSLLLCLSGNPLAVAAQSSMPMVEMMRAMLVMMEMFSWMMGGGNSWYGGQPYGAGFSPVNPYLAGTSPFGLGGSTFPGHATPGLNSYSMGLWSYPAYMGNFPFNRLYPGVIPYSGIPGNPALGNWQNLAGSPFSNWYSDSYANPWHGAVPSAGTQSWQSPYADYARSQAPATPVVVQPIIVQPSGNGQGSSTGTPSVILPAPYPPASSQPPAAKGPRWSAEKLLRGQWLGINGEFLEFDGKHFQLVDGDIYLSGTYEVRNRILKAELEDSDTPIYMQYRMQNEHLMFRSEDNQLMLFRRVRR